MLRAAAFEGVEHMQVPASPVVLTGKTASGIGKARGFTQLRWVQEEFERKLGIRPWPGTFNVRLDPGSQAEWTALTRRPGIEIDPPDASACVARCYRVVLAHVVEGAIVLPHVEGYPPDQVEVAEPLCIHDLQVLRPIDEASSL